MRKMRSRKFYTSLEVMTLIHKEASIWIWVIWLPSWCSLITSGISRETKWPGHILFRRYHHRNHLLGEGGWWGISGFILSKFPPQLNFCLSATALASLIPQKGHTRCAPMQCRALARHATPQDFVAGNLVQIFTPLRSRRCKSFLWSNSMKLLNRQRLHITSYCWKSQ